MTSYLYKGLRQEEVLAAKLIPKRQGAFSQFPQLPVKAPFFVGSTVENAAQNHQKEDGTGRYCSSGVSTSLRREVAVRYATERNTKRGFVAHIRRDLLAAHGIKESDVSACGDVRHPEDCEIILYDGIGLPMPVEIIEMIEEICPKS